MANQVCVIGLGRFGAKLATTLYQGGHEVLAIDQKTEQVQQMIGRVTYAVESDATIEAGLLGLGVADMDVAVVALGSQIESSIITTMLLKTMGIPFVIARATDTRHAEILHRVGADKVIFPEEEAAVRAATLDLTPNSIEYIGITDTDGLHKLRPPERMRGRRLREIGLEGDNSNSPVRVMVLQRGREYIMNPGDNELIGDGDLLIVAGSHEQIARTFER